MNVLFCLIVTLLLIVIQTVILPSFSWFTQSFDLLIIDVLFLCLVFSHYSIIFSIIIIGCIMDSISGSPLGFHLFSYVWIYIIVHLGKQTLFKQSIIFILIVSLTAVIIQHGLLLFYVYVNHGETAILEFDFSLLMRQAFWGVVFISPGIWFINVCHQNWIFLVKLLQKKMIQG